ncbi:MAG: GNAT family N-acetyltransferase [Verrucomicrobiota bacterium]|nr:GNAT family N-acetyltransferase [Verrucomicrobiota bacterium]
MSFLPPNFDIRYSELSDLDILQKWFADPAVCDPFPFGFDEKDDALKNWVGFSKFQASLTGTVGGIPCAMGTLFLMPYRKVAHHCSFYLIVDASHRKKGIGTSMVRNLLHLAKTRFRLESVHAEIYEPNPLLSILQKLRFEEFARQENFVKLNGQPHSRVLMEHFL